MLIRMKKTFTVLSVTHTVVSPERGSMTWYLSDELSHSRKVTAVTQLNQAEQITAAKPVYNREKPLIDCLLYKQEGETFTIDFTSFNEEMGYLKREVFADMQTLEQAGKLSHRVNRILFWLVMLVICWLGWLTFDSFQDFALQQQPRLMD